MSVWVSSVAHLTAFFERRVQWETCQRNAAGSREMQTSESSTNGPGPAKDAARLAGPEVKAEDRKMVGDVWNELLRHARESQSSSKLHVLCATGNNLKRKETANVQQEVCKRELITLLEKAYAVLVKDGEKENHEISEEQATINSLKRRLSEKSEEVKSVREALQSAVKVRCELEYICEEHEQKRRKMFCLLKEVEGENKELRNENLSLVEAVKDLKADIEQLQGEKSVCEVESLRAQHKAEMAELAAKQASSQSMKLDERVKNAESSSRWIHERMQELERVLEEMTTVLTTSTSINGSERPRSHRLGGQVEALVHKSSKLLGRFAGSHSRDKNVVSGTRGSEEETNMETTAEDGNANMDEAPAPRSGKKRSLGLLSHRNSGNGEETQAGFLRKLTSRLRREASCQRNGPEPRGAPAVSANGPRRNDRRVLGDGEPDVDGSSSAKPKLTGFKRMLSRGSPLSHSERRRQLQSSDTHTMEFMSKTLEALRSNFGVLQDVFEFKEEEIHHLHHQLREAVNLSNAFEQGMRSEYQKRLELEESMAGTGKVSPMKKKPNILRNSIDQLTDEVGNPC